MVETELFKLESDPERLNGNSPFISVLSVPRPPGMKRGAGSRDNVGSIKKSALKVHLGEARTN